MQLYRKIRDGAVTTFAMGKKWLYARLLEDVLYIRAASAVEK